MIISLNAIKHIVLLRDLYFSYIVSILDFTYRYGDREQPLMIKCLPFLNAQVNGGLKGFSTNRRDTFAQHFFPTFLYDRIKII